MAWTLHRWVWRLESPLYIGAPPAGSLNRTRLYIPARTFWGALTAALAPQQNRSEPNYRQTGEQLSIRARLSYLFPAEQVAGEWQAWLPRYQQGQGLVWERENGQEKLDDRTFRHRLVVSRPGTAIAPESDTAEEGSLREFDLLSPYWREKHQPLRPVAMVGYFFCRDGKILQSVNEVQELFVGGDTRYGLGRLSQAACVPASAFFDVNDVDLQTDSPVITTSRILAHVEAESSPPLQGALEALRGWDIAAGLRAHGFAWVPGSVCSSPHRFEMQQDGRWSSSSSARAAPSSGPGSP